MVIPFTTSMIRQAVHFVDSTHLRSYAQCLGGECLLCRVGNRIDTRDLLPVYEPVMRAVCVLPISLNQRPMALRPQMHPLLLRISKGERLLITLRKIDTTRFSVAACQLPEDADHGAEQIARFTEQLEAGTIDLRSVYPRVDAAELAALPEIATRMTLKRMTL
jgi:hypothetical protein